MTGPRHRQSGRVHAVLVMATLLVGLGTTWTARADERDRCASASERAQPLRRRGRLLAARDELLVCARPVCPRIIVTDCEQWLSEVDAELPTVVIAARDAAGRDRADVRVLVDGTERLARIDGKPLALDPGPHVVRYESAGLPALEDHIVVRQGEKDRLLAVELGVTTPRASAAPEQAAAGSPTLGRDANGPSTEAAAMPTAVWVAGGVGIAALGGFAVLAVHGQSQYGDCESSRSCSRSDVDAIAVERAAAWVSLGVGAVAMGVATYLYLSRPAPRRAAVSLAPLPGGALGGVVGRF